MSERPLSEEVRARARFFRDQGLIAEADYQECLTCDIAALEAENARLRKVYEAAARINGYRTDTRDFARLEDAIREAMRDA